MTELRDSGFLERLARAPSLLVLCEFDGVLAEFVADPSAARPVDGALDVLTDLSLMARTRSAIISGRSLDSLRAVCDDSSALVRSTIELIGSGGMEIESQMTLGLTADARRMRGLLVQAAAEVARCHPGVTVDEKPYGVALHVRAAVAGDGQHAIDRMLALASALPHRVYSQTRSHVLDLSVLPVGQDWAIDALRERDHAVVFYAGNDERAFAALGPHDVGCTVGGCCNGGAVGVDTPAQLVELLNCVADQRGAITLQY
jgi:trehalose 6-phosphate phosphatase